MPHNVSLISTIAVGLGFALVLGFIVMRLRLPARQLRQCPQTIWPSALTRCPVW